ncbi:MAG: hypothetical protein JKY52_08500 [Flavobacteriales bacterium]|nr:hypothetical protein [Flavobacteriales bacterium]
MSKVLGRALRQQEELRATKQQKKIDSYQAARADLAMKNAIFGFYFAVALLVAFLGGGLYLIWRVLG